MRRESLYPRTFSTPAAALLIAALLGGVHGTAVAADTTPQEQFARFRAAAGTPASVERGKSFFDSTHGNDWSCSTCHGMPPVREGTHATTRKAIEPLAPAANPRAFTSTTRVDKWLRRNCRDVLDRDCTDQEKADLMAYLLSIDL